MFGISFEHLLIVGVVLLLFGPRRLPELGHTMGKAIKNFKDSLSGVEEASFKRIQENEKPGGPQPDSKVDESRDPHSKA
ncbi:MAG: twin-arginine translocase TatA/TatE family subunit [Bdellovibrionales bacterium]|nr:twin-arginine translocase TatA/TatE family subunit [Bdellovibrionales bacterium]